ncbi:anhydro-N-acetylmuramic acid kinase [Spirosoma montaniterrae]|uniref:Anhydro-N-acetylmuramic acid kinase n=1 Tax=Spirosoma montaniterrae TaxID=1178516 RepID=A0A1P9X3A2_9BACT|nr:anhydro-N-acetylmuramic acid kinase [Spirosoma montaniterrae]AQG82104.1 anhydro-N-acetylmuramic acid kinase [Spirosoma montaniterrae]
MNPQIQKLHQIAGKPERRIIGLMSGTSLDGLDVALCRIAGSGPATAVTLERFATVPYTDDLKNDIRTIFAKSEIDFEELCLLNPYIGRLHGQMVLDCLREWGISPVDVDAIASHGQTVYHAPKSQHQRDKFPNATLQIGDGDHVAVTTGIIALSDFRQKHVAAGGEGAPLAVYGDYFMFSKAGENRILLNMGGIANFTYLPADEDATVVFTTDTGPGNTLLDAYARKFLNKPYDENGALAASGTVDADLLAALKSNPFFDAPFPKTTGPEVFNPAYVETAKIRSQTTHIAPADLMATLVQFSADTIVEAVGRLPHPNPSPDFRGGAYAVYMSGGGMHNPALTGAIQRQLPNCTFGRTDELGINGDAKEAVLFAVLANECLTGGDTSFGDRQGVPSVTMGKISLPG